MKNPFRRGTHERWLYNHDRRPEAWAKIRKAGFDALLDWKEEDDFDYILSLPPSDLPRQVVPYPDCPWPILTDEAKTCIQGWNEACVENYLDEER